MGLLHSYYPSGVLLVSSYPGLPPSLTRTALRSEHWIENRLHMATAEDPTLLHKLRRAMAPHGPSRGFSDRELISFTSRFAARGMQLMVIDIADQMISLADPAAGRSSRQLPDSWGDMSLTTTLPASIESMDLQDKFVEVLSRSPKYMPGQLGEEFKAMISPAALIGLAVTLAAWAVAHFFGVGEAIDVILIAIGLAMIGLQIFSAAGIMLDAVTHTVNAKTEEDLEVAAAEFAKFIAMVGVATFLALLTKGLAKFRKQGLEHGRPLSPYERMVGKKTGRFGHLKDPKSSDDLIMGRYKKYITSDKQSGDLAQKGFHKMTTEQMQKEWLDGKIRWERQQKGRPLTTAELREYRDMSKRVGGFAGGGEVWVSDAVPTDSYLHETMHLYSNPAVKNKYGSALNEGMTDYFTRKETGTLGMTKLDPYTTGYPKTANAVADGVKMYGEEPFRQAYFSGNTQALENAMGQQGFQNFLGNVGGAFKGEGIP